MTNTISKFTLYHGNCLDEMKKLSDNSVDSIVCDPPYALTTGNSDSGFMGKKWDGALPTLDMWKEALRVAKPGAHLLAFGSPRTFHRLTCAIEDSGWEIRDILSWNYGSGFPKSHNISKAIDKLAGAEREVIGIKPGHEEFANRSTDGHIKALKNTGGGGKGGFGRPWMDDELSRESYHMLTAPATDAAKQWDGWGTALKPAYEPIIMARKPVEGTIANNVLLYGTGGLNIDACRIEATNRPHRVIDPKPEANGSVYAGRRTAGTGFDGGSKAVGQTSVGRWPANVLFDEEAAELLDAQTGNVPGQMGKAKTDGSAQNNKIYGALTHGTVHPEPRNDAGGPSRFFYCSKASRKERSAGLPDGNAHPTVKPLAVMQWLCKLVTPPNGIILDPFMGSGSTGCAAIQEGFQFIGIDAEEEYVEIAKQRLEHWSQ